MTPIKKISIMLIDDHTLIRESWCALLAAIENMEIVAECGDGRLAGELAKNARPNIVLPDLNMKPMNGFEVLKIQEEYLYLSGSTAITCPGKQVKAIISRQT